MLWVDACENEATRRSVFSPQSAAAPSCACGPAIVEWSPELVCMMMTGFYS
jgi:hypothetical protein